MSSELYGGQDPIALIPARPERLVLRIYPGPQGHKEWWVMSPGWSEAHRLCRVRDHELKVVILIASQYARLNWAVG
jgi:hypothetical protein